MMFHVDLQGCIQVFPAVGQVPLLLHFDVNKTVIQSDSVQMKGANRFVWCGAGGGLGGFANEGLLLLVCSTVFGMCIESEAFKVHRKIT